MGRKPINIKIVEQLNRKWVEFNDKGLFTQSPNPVLKPDSAVFTMGSCFAVEIRHWLRNCGCHIVPDYLGLQFDPKRIQLGNLPVRDNLNYYHTFSIRQEFERVQGLWEQSEDDMWEVQPDRWFGGNMAFQDPYRRAVYGKTPEDLCEAIEILNKTIRAGVEIADIFLITLGLTEVWRKKNDGRFACMNPGYAQGGGYTETEFHRSTISENIENLEQTVHLIRKRRPDAHIIFTVSPVPLGATFTNQDVFVANMESKSILRTAATHVCRSCEQVSYFPAFDLCAAIGDVYTPDGRHVRPEIVKAIVTLFQAQHEVTHINTPSPQVMSHA